MRPPEVTPFPGRSGCLSLLHGLGKSDYQISRYHTDRDSVSIVLKGKQKAKEFRISQLLEDIANEFLCLLELRKKKKAKEEELKAQQEQEQSNEDEQEI